MAEFIDIDWDEVSRLERAALDKLEHGGPVVDNKILQQYVLGTDHPAGDLEEGERKKIWKLICKYRLWKIAYDIQVSTLNTLGSD